jgi:hypothetical protein
MPKYSQTEIELWISRANKCLYKLGTKSTDERFFEEDSTYEDEKILIYCLKKSIAWVYTFQSISATELGAVVSLLISRINIYDFGKQIPMFNTGTTALVGLGGGQLPSPPSPSTPVPNDIMLIGGVDITPGVTSFSDVRLTGLRFRIVRNSLNFYDWFKSGNTIYLTGVNDAVVAGDVFVIQFY